MRMLASVLLCGLVVSAGVHAEDWPHWRGPDGRRISNERGLPTRWSPLTVAWQTPLRGLGVSSPIVSGDLVFLTSQMGRGPLRPGGHPALVRGGAEPDSERPLGGERVAGSGDGTVFVVSAFNRADGAVAWEYEIEAEGDLPSVHQKHNMASPSPVADGERVYVWFATGQLVAFDMQGEVAWERHLANDYGPFEIVWGHSSSPTIYDDLLILQCDHEAGAYLLALDRRTGEERWKADRGAGLRSFSTPTVVAGPNGLFRRRLSPTAESSLGPTNRWWRWGAAMATDSAAPFKR